jgi:thioredoxin reductase
MDAVSEKVYDAIIVGGGPAGLSAALVLGRACRSVVIIDAGRPRNAAAREMHCYLGRDGTPPHDLLSDGRKEVAKYEVELVPDTVVKAEKLSTSERLAAGAAFTVETAEERVFAGRKLLFATGTCDELPEFPGVRECYGATVHHCPYCDGWEHRGERILVYGKELKEAVGLALALKGWSSVINVLADGQPIDSEQSGRLTSNSIRWAAEPIARFVHHGDQLDGVELADGRIIPAEAMFFHTKQRPGCELPRSLGVVFDEPFSGRTSRKQKTNVPGLYIAGDADGDVQFMIVAAAEGATAAVAINRELQEEDRSANLRPQPNKHQPIA